MATTRPLSAMVATWNNVATTFTGLKLNVTDTASAAGSLMDLQVGGVSQFKVDKAGIVDAAGRFVAPFYYVNSDTGAIFFGASLDTGIQRDGAANTLALRNGTAGQAFRVYKTYTDGSNYERGSWYTDVNGFHLETQSAGTGTSQGFYVGTVGAGSLNFQTNNSTRWYVGGSDGHLLAVTDNTYDIGASGANRPRNLYVANTITGAAFVGNAANGFNFSSRGFIVAPANGVFKLSDQADADFNLLQFGGTTSSFPAIKRSTTGLQVRLADDSAFAPLASSTVTTSDTAFLHNTSAALANGAAAQVATMTNGPTAGNPTKWIAINDNGVTRYIPAW